MSSMPKYFFNFNVEIHFVALLSFLELPSAFRLRFCFLLFNLVGYVTWQLTWRKIGGAHCHSVSSLGLGVNLKSFLTVGG